MTQALTPDMLLAGYAQGIFPMALTRDDPVLHWFRPEARGIIPLNGFHISRSLARTIRRQQFEIRIDTAFEQVIQGCANRDETWINARLRVMYVTLYRHGYAHSVEVWQQGRLVGGVFAVTLGAAFFGESMFSAVKDASKVALAYTVDRLNQTGFKLFDTQYLTPHLASLGGIEIPAKAYEKQLNKALDKSADFTQADIPSPQVLLQRMTHTS